MGKYSKYKHVTFLIVNGKHKYWQGELGLDNGRYWKKYCKTEKEAARAVDIKLIELGREPVNILKRK